MSEDKVLRRRNVGPYLDKERMKEKMSIEDAQAQLNTVMFWVEKIGEYERAISNINIALNGMAESMNCVNLNHLLSVLTKKSGSKVKKEK